MRTWAVQDAKARFSELVDVCLKEGPQMVTRRGAEAAVLVPATQWHRMQVASRPSLKELLLSNEARTDQLTLERPHKRGKARRRRIDALN